MRVLIGTPVHRSKDYAMARWIESVRALDFDADVLLVDNSEEAFYQEKLIRLTGWRVGRLVLTEDDPERRMAVLNEAIRQVVIDEGYDGWFAWDCDLVLPPMALQQLLVAAIGYDAVVHAYPDRLEPTRTVGSRFGCAYLTRKALLSHGFLGQVGAVDPLNPGCWCGSEPWFLERLVRAGGTWVELHGVIRPIQHLSS